MLKRILSAAVGIALLVTVLFVSDEYKYIFNGMICLLSMISVGEIFVATKYISQKFLLVVSLLFAAFIPFANIPLLRPYVLVVIFLYIVVLFAIMILWKKKVSLDKISMIFMLCTLIPCGFSTLVALRDIGFLSGMAKRDGIFLLLVACAGAWLADTGAYFAGRLFGKHKLSPEISPNKTVEGFIGGVIVDMAGLALAAYIYQEYFSCGAQVNIWFMMVFGFFAAFLGTLGDLSASYIKRSCRIKDFGNIMPGHGGVMDRFDSILLVAPFLFLMVSTLDTVWPVIVR